MSLSPDFFPGSLCPDYPEQNKKISSRFVISFSLQDSDFMSVTGLLSGSVKRFTGMAHSGRDNCKLLCYVSAGLVGLFFLLYFLVSRAST